MAWKVAFTGTREGLTAAQGASLRRFMRVMTGKDQDAVGRHGACLGADSAFARAAHELGWYVVAHPSDLGLTCPEALACSDEVLGNCPPLERNRLMVDALEVLLACPRLAAEERRSGTWATVRHARRVGVPVVLVLPDGTVVKEAADGS